MNIDITRLKSGIDSQVEIDMLYSFDKEMLKKTDIISLDNINENRHKQMAVWTSFENGVYSIKNWTSLLRDDTGCIPIEFFGGDFSWEFKPWGFF